MQLLPKLTAIVSPVEGLDLFAHFGRGFHSNDAQGAVLGEGAATLIRPRRATRSACGSRPCAGCR